MSKKITCKTGLKKEIISKEVYEREREFLGTMKKLEDKIKDRR